MSLRMTFASLLTMLKTISHNWIPQNSNEIEKKTDHLFISPLYKYWQGHRDPLIFYSADNIFVLHHVYYLANILHFISV